MLDARSCAFRARSWRLNASSTLETSLEKEGLPRLGNSSRERDSADLFWLVALGLGLCRVNKGAYGAGDLVVSLA